jgi:hypothetical protein
MKYQQKSFTLPTTNKQMSTLEYDLRVGNITEREFCERACATLPTESGLNRYVSHHRACPFEWKSRPARSGLAGHTFHGRKKK